MADLAKQDEFVELRARGVSYQKIAEKLGVSKQTLINWSKERSLDIQNMTTLQKEALRERHYLSEIARIEGFGTLLQAIRKELDTRDFSGIATEKLIELCIKCLNEPKDNQAITFKKLAPSMLVDWNKEEEWLG